MKPENYLPYYMFPLSEVCRLKVQITCTLCNFCPCFPDSWCKSCCGWQREKQLLCCVELASEQNREQFLTLYFLLSTGTTLWFSAWFLRRRDKNYLWNQYQSPHECQVLSWPSTRRDSYHSLPYRKSSLTAERQESFPKIKTTYKLQISLAKMERIY